MEAKNQSPFFSVIIPTRDRPELFSAALASVANQSLPNTEIIVIVDGSADGALQQYRDIEEQQSNATFYYLVHRADGHGQSYTMNYGAEKANGQYLCFLDDDDYWTDDSYLQRLFNCLSTAGNPVDVHYSNQKAIFADGTEQTNKVWLEDLIQKVDATTSHQNDCYFVDADFLLSSAGFAHMNCSVFRREFYLSIGGMDVDIRYECDRDIYIRAIDAANIILFSTHYMSLHNIPDTRKKLNMSTVASDIEKRQYQINVYDKNVSLCKNDSVRQFCRTAKTYELKHMATILARKKDYGKAAPFARKGLVDGFNLRWCAYTAYLTLMALGSSHRPALDNKQ